MSIEIKVPVLPESVADATIATWYKKEGDTVKQDENLVDIETDKVMLECPAPQAGVIKEIKSAEGATVLAEEVIAVLEVGEVSKSEEPRAQNSTETDEKISRENPAKDNQALTPAVRRVVSEHQLDVSSVKGTGKDGRLSKEDVLKEVKAAPTEHQESSEVADVSLTAREEKRVPMSRLRQKIAERLVDAQKTAAILTTFNEVDLKAIIDLRSQYKDSFQKKHGVKLGFMSFFIKASVEALKQFPAVNASIDGNDILYHNYFDVGVAVSTDRGLVVPVIKDADLLSMAQLEQAVSDYGVKARDSKLTMDDLQGGTFTVSNGGVFGSLLATPILNPPQSAILGMHKIEQRPVVVDGEITIRPMMYLALSYDHRIIDGKESVLFLKTIKELLEDPARILLEL